MKDNYDFSKSRRNPYAKQLKKQVTIRLDQDVLSYFRELAEETDRIVLTWPTAFETSWKPGSAIAHEDRFAS